MYLLLTIDTERKGGVLVKKYLCYHISFSLKLFNQTKDIEMPTRWLLDMKENFTQWTVQTASFIWIIFNAKRPGYI